MLNIHTTFYNKIAILYLAITYFTSIVLIFIIKKNIYFFISPINMNTININNETIEFDIRYLIIII